MIKAVGINDSVGFRAFKSAKNGHAHNDINNKVEKNNIVEIQEKPLLLASFLQPKKSVSFKAYMYDETPTSWTKQLDGVVTDFGVNEKHSYSYSAPMDPVPLASELTEDKANWGKAFPYYTTENEYSSMYSYPIRKVPVKNGFLYINDIGKLTWLRGEDIDESKKMPNVDANDTTQFVLEHLIPVYEKDGFIEERKALFATKKFLSSENIQPQIDYLLEEGRPEDAIELYPDLADEINTKEAQLKKVNCSTRQNGEIDEFETFLLNGDIKNILAYKSKYTPSYGYSIDFKYEDKLPKSVRNMSKMQVKEIINAFNDDKFLENLVAQKKKDAKAQALKEALAVEEDKQARVAMAIMTLGVTELVYQYRLYTEEEPAAVHEYNEKIDAVSDLMMMISEAKQKHNIENRVLEERSLLFEEEKQKVRNKLKDKFITPLNAYKTNKNVFVPNSVMLYGDNPSLMKDIIFDLKDLAKANFVQIDSKINLDNMQEELFEQLEQAEENYQNTNERSIIFVNGMEKLLNPRFNSPENIACMKDFMSSASEDYHSTIIFYSRHPEKLDAGAMMSHRVNVPIKVPVEFVAK